jgi:hypothetical protein
MVSATEHDDEAPVEDVLEQHRTAEAEPDESADAAAGSANPEADDADLAEQAREVPVGDDEYR